MIRDLLDRQHREPAMSKSEERSRSVLAAFHLEPLAVGLGRRVPPAVVRLVAERQHRAAVVVGHDHEPALPDETLPAFLGAGSPTVAPRPHDAESLPGDLRETATVRAAVEALHEAVGMADAGCRKDAAAAAWHAEPILRLFCSAFGCAIAGTRVSEGGVIVVTAEPSAADAVEVSITVGPEGTCACTVSAGDMHLACTAPDVQSFERAVRERLTEAGVLDSGQ